MLSYLINCVEELENVCLNKYNTMKGIEFFRAKHFHYFNFSKYKIFGIFKIYCMKQAPSENVN